MIRFSDLTLNETDGNFNEVKHLMGQGTWMLKSETSVIGSDGFAANYILHLWNDGSVVIFETSHPLYSAISDTDLQELKAWTERNGWSRLAVDKRLLVDPRGFNFWLQKYQMGIVESDELKSHADEEQERMSRILDEKEEED